MPRFLRMSERSAKSRRDEVQRWYEQHGPALVAYASAILGERSRAEDALQQVFYKLLKGKMEVPAMEKAYLFRAVRNTALSMARRNRREVALDDEAAEHGLGTAGTGAARRCRCGSSGRCADQRRLECEPVSREAWSACP